MRVISSVAVSSGAARLGPGPATIPHKTSSSRSAHRFHLPVLGDIGGQGGGGGEGLLADLLIGDGDAIGTLDGDRQLQGIDRVEAQAAAKQRGKLIGRKKLRDSDLIRKLLKSGLSYRRARSSPGAVMARSTRKNWQ